MSATTTHTISDSVTMLGRNLKHIRRYPSVPMFVAGTPIVFLLLFVYVFGGTLGAGLGGQRSDYLAYIVPGILLVGIAGSGTGTAISVATDMTEGIIARFRSMDISRSAVLTGHVLGNLIQTLGALLLILIVAVLIGFRPEATSANWVSTAGVLILITTAITWLCVAMGLASGSVESASNQPTFLLLLPFLGSGFVPTESMPGPLQTFADIQPFTPFIETLRALLTDTPLETTTLIATIAWCAGIGLASYAWAQWLYPRKTLQ